jgi:pimeloyl-ACP methyl ester carboxylesterase
MTDAVYSPEVLRHFSRVGYGDFDYPAELDRVSAPTLVIVGAEDRITTPRAARVLHEGIADSELAILEAAGHMSFVEARDEYVAAVGGFLRRAVGLK